MIRYTVKLETRLQAIYSGDEVGEEHDDAGYRIEQAGLPTH